MILWLSGITRTYPDGPAKFSIAGDLDINEVENLSVMIEWFKPATRKGSIRKYIIGGSSISRHSRASDITLEFIEFRDPDEKLDSYQTVLNGLPSFSTCNISVAAETRVVRGESVHCGIQTRLIGINFSLKKHHSLK